MGSVLSSFFFSCGSYSGTSRYVLIHQNAFELLYQQYLTNNFDVVSHSLLNSVYLLCDHNLQPVGTTFVVSRTGLLTAFHNVGDTTGLLYSETWTLVLTLERNKAGRITNSCGVTIPVNVSAVCPDSDWCVLQRTDGKAFPSADIPQLSAVLPEREMRVKFYHCPVSLFNDVDDPMEIVQACSIDASIAMVSKHAFYCQVTLFRGSSGALVTLMSGEVIGMHIEAVHTMQRSASIAAADPTLLPYDVLSQASDSVIDAGGSMAKVVTLSMHRKLCLAINKTK